MRIKKEDLERLLQLRNRDIERLMNTNKRMRSYYRSLVRWLYVACIILLLCVFSALWLYYRSIK